MGEGEGGEVGARLQSLFVQTAWNLFKPRACGMSCVPPRMSLLWQAGLSVVCRRWCWEGGVGRAAHGKSKTLESKVKPVPRCKRHVDCMCRIHPVFNGNVHRCPGHEAVEGRALRV